MRCPRCGCANPDGVPMCQNCRASLVRAADALQEAPSAYPPAPERQRGTKWLFPVLVGLMLMLGLMYLLALGGFVHQVSRRLTTQRVPQRASRPTPTQAISQLRRAVQDDPDNAQLHYLLALALDQQKRHTEAVKEYQEAARLEPDNDHYLVEMGVCQYRLGDIEGSKASYEKALEINSANWVAHDNLGFDCYDLGETEEAVEHWEKAAQLKADEADIWAGLAIGRLAQGDEQAALQAYQTAVDHDQRYLDPEWMKVEALWSDKALEAAEGLMGQVEAPAAPGPAPPAEPTLDI